MTRPFHVIRKCKNCDKPVMRNQDASRGFLGHWIHTTVTSNDIPRWICRGITEVTEANVEGEENAKEWYSEDILQIQGKPATVVLSITKLTPHTQGRKFRF